MNIDEAKNMIEEGAKDLIDICPHCGSKAHIEKQWSDYHIHNNRNIEFYLIFKCRPCKMLLLKTYIFDQNEFSEHINLSSGGWDEKFPTHLESDLTINDKSFIPKDVFDDYIEALKCKSIGTYKAACSMFRRTLQMSLLELGANKKEDLFVQITSLSNLPDDIKDWAHQIRIFGNWGTHPDQDNLKDVDEDTTIEVQDFISKFLTFMFIMPEKVKLSRKRREDKIKDK